MGREVKRVPMDFNWPMKKIWPGYCITMYDTITDLDCEHFAEIMKAKYEDASDLLSIDPPIGDGWQMWETTSEGSPMSPVFSTAEELARWLADSNASAMGDQGATYEQWLATCRIGGAPSMILDPVYGIRSGVAAAVEWGERGDK